MADNETKEVRIKPDLTKYVNGVSGSGKKTKRSDDPVAAALDGFTVEEVCAVASKMTDVTQKDLMAKYAHLNVGMQRMNLGNRIRGAVAKLDKAHEADKAVPDGLTQLALHAQKGQDAVAKRAKATADARAKREKEAEAKAEAKAKKEAAKAKAKPKAA